MAQNNPSIDLSRVHIPTPKGFSQLGFARLLWADRGGRAGWWLVIGENEAHCVHGPSICVSSGGGPLAAAVKARTFYSGFICVEAPPKHSQFNTDAECAACADLATSINQLIGDNMRHHDPLNPNYLRNPVFGVKDERTDRAAHQMRLAADEIDRLRHALAERDQNLTEAPLIPVYEFPVVGQTWQHYKGDRYTVVGLGPDAVTGVPTVSYRALKQTAGRETPLHPRSLDSFLQSIDLPPEGQYASQNKTGPRHAQRFVRVRDGVEA